MKAMTYEVKFDPELDLGDISFFLKEIKSLIRLEIGDKIALSEESFSPFAMNNYNINEMMEILLKKSIKASTYYAYFEISDIIYYHIYDEVDFGFHGVITLKGK